MKINVFGVGRSGTKAVQLYLAYLLAYNQGKVKINYEPYYWKDRRARNLNYEGIFYHQNTPLFTSKGDIVEKHKDFLLELVSGEFSTITKFIRANGRINEINQITKPDLTVVIIRNLYQVLKSLDKFSWDFFGDGLVYKNDWPRFLSEVKRKNIVDDKEFNYILNNITSRNDRNAFYWYIMNLEILKYNKEQVVFINYNNLHSLERVQEDYQFSISEGIFKGSNIHGDYPLIEYSKKDITDSQKNIDIDWAINFLNTEYYDVGNKEVLKKDKDEYIVENDLYNYFNSKIFKLLGAKNQTLPSGLIVTKKKEIIEVVKSQNNIKDIQKYKWVVSKDFVNYVLDSNVPQKIAIIGSKDMVRLLNNFINISNSKLGKNISVEQSLYIGSTGDVLLNNKTLSFLKNEIDNIDKLIVACMEEEKVINELLKFSVNPDKVIFNNKKFPFNLLKKIYSKRKDILPYSVRLEIYKQQFSGELIGYLTNLNENENVIIFGAGSAGKELLRFISDTNSNKSINLNITNFMDNNEQKWGKRFCETEFEIIKPEVSFINKADKIIIASMWAVDIKKQLLNMGVAQQKIIMAIKGQ